MKKVTTMSASAMETMSLKPWSRQATHLQPEQSPARSQSQAWLKTAADTWHLALQRFIVWLYFDRVSVHGAEHLRKAQGPLLLLGLHRNGAVDGFVYHALAPRAEFMVTARLLRKRLVRLFLSGIEVVREKDRDRVPRASAINARAMEECQERLRTGGQLCIFPEGTSTLGPRHLPFQSGAAHLVLHHLESAGAPPLTVLPVGIHYEAPADFRSRLDLLVGEPVEIQLPPCSTRAQKLCILKQRFETALESVGVNVESSAQQDTIQRLAYVATLGTSRTYSHTLKQLEPGIPPLLEDEWQKLALEFDRPGLWLHQGVPLFPVLPIPLMLVALAILGPLTAAGWLLNLPPLLAGAWAGRKFPDEANVVALWRILVGVPILFLWSTLLLATCAFTGHAFVAALYLVVTFAAIKLSRRTRNIAIEINNGLRHRGLHERALRFHQLVLTTLPDETH
jgi:1-acyl-sn-glycerol-3-phosphate acyltransferase